MKFIELSGTKRGQSVLDALQENGISIPAECGGTGNCGKCKIRIINGNSEPSAVERKAFSDSEIAGGWRLACEVKSEDGMRLEYPCAEEIISCSKEISGMADAGKNTAFRGGETGNTRRPAMALDVGTTTIAAALLDTATGKVLSTETAMNHQRGLGGADVMSRIKAANEGKLLKLKEAVWEDITQLAIRLGAGGDELPVREDIPVIISANTTMQHIMRGLPCGTLGIAPYIPVDLSAHRDGGMLYLPGKSAFVGADIVSGLFATGLYKSDKTVLFVDLGTNGEMAIGNSDRILVASTAAGPAFEGGNIKCGCPGIDGAISRVKIFGDKIDFETIGDREPIGICGSGVIDIMYELLRAGYVDESGCFDETHFEMGFVLCKDMVFTQEDIREIQLAKAAVCAGIETLTAEFGTDFDHIDRLYLAGGFGQKINLESACGIGIIPTELQRKTVAVGNTSLAGAVKVGINPEKLSELEKIVSMSEEVILADSMEFGERYIERMNFGE